MLRRWEQGESIGNRDQGAMQQAEKGGWGGGGAASAGRSGRGWEVAAHVVGV
mgnify:CR=1 FL=1